MADMAGGVGESAVADVSCREASPAFEPSADGPNVEDGIPLQPLVNLKLMGSGGAAGAVAKTATAPLARLTILYQVRLLDCA